MLDNRNKLGVRGRLFPSGRGAINHYRDEHDGRKGRGKRFGPPGGEGRQSLEWYQDVEVQLGVVAWELRGPPQSDPPWPAESRVSGRHQPPDPWGLDQVGLGR